MFFIRPMLLWSAIVYNMQEVISCTDEYRLVKHLMSSYDPAVRPVINSSEPLEVTFGISLHHIIDLEEKDQLLTTNCWITQMWTDHHLKWNASEFGGISVIRMPFERVWRPDIILYNNADPNYRSAVINTNVIVQNNGEVLWLSHGIYVSVCDINVEHFPFDIQLCTLKWASWTYDGYQLDLKKQFNKGDTSNYQTNGEFDLISFDATRNEQFYSCCPEPYPDITFEIKLKRRPMFYVFNLILPCLLINGIALLVFYVPSESGEKVTLGISALLSMTVFLMTIRDTLPPTEKTPLITLYYGVSTCLVSFSASLSVVTLNISYRGVRGLPVPPLIRRIVLDRLAKLLCFKFETTKYKPVYNEETLYRLQNLMLSLHFFNTIFGFYFNGHIERFCLADGRLYQLSDETILMKQAAQFSFVKKNSSGKFQHLEGVQGNSRTASRLRDSISECPSIGGSPRFRSKHYHSTIGMTPAGLGDNMCCGCCILRDAVVRHEQRVAASEHTDRACLEWKQVAVVMDRALLTTFILLTVVSTATILLPQTRHFYLDESFQVNATSHQ